MSISLSLGEYPEEVKDAQIDAPAITNKQNAGEKLLGMNLATLDANNAKLIRGANKLKGVLVIAVANDSEAAQRSISEGDIILGVNQVNITTLDELKAEIGKAKIAKREYVLVRIWRAGDSSYITLPVDK
jgi:serine protease Do